ncbi:MAG: class I SAM-dependent methyltransferase [Vicingaceae bacterium]
MGLFYTIAKYTNYKLKSINEHKIHSPFVYELVTDVLYDKNPFYVFDDIESIRAKLKLSTKKITVSDYGANASYKNSNIKSIASIVNTSSKRKKYCEVLFKLVNKYKPLNIIELGTNLGISSMYIASGNKNSRVVTIEGCPNLSKIAQINFNKLGLNNIQLINGVFDESFPKVLEGFNAIDFIFFDGNHRKEATLNYFYKGLEKVHNDSIFVFDDIYWSKGMTEAWEEIKQNSKVTCTIDIFEMGIVFFKKELSKEHFIVNF